MVSDPGNDPSGFHPFQPRETLAGTTGCGSPQGRGGLRLSEAAPSRLPGGSGREHVGGGENSGLMPLRVSSYPQTRFTARAGLGVSSVVAGQDPCSGHLQGLRDPGNPI